MLRRIAARGWSVLRSTCDGWQRHDGGLMSAATAYYAAFSLFPLCLVLVAGAGFVGRYSEFVNAQQQNLLAHVSQNVSPWLADELNRVLTGVESRAMLGGPLGLLALVLTAIGVFMQLENIFARIWGEPAPSGRGDVDCRSNAQDARAEVSPLRTWPAAIREALWNRLSAFLTLLAIGVLLVAVSATNVVLAGLRPYLTSLPAGRPMWHMVQTLATIGCDAVLLTLIYRVLPKARIRWRDALGGGLLAAVIWALGRSALLFLLVGTKYGAYGVLGALMGVMLWFYYASAVVFLGAEFVHAMGSTPLAGPGGKD
jgi:membrane protein